MSELVRKEIRLLLPSFGSALALALSIWLLPNAAGASGWQPILAVLPYVCCPAMVVMLALESFGGEISAGTLSGLLAQPVSRARIWRTKTALLALAIGLVTVAWCLSFLGHAPFDSNAEDVTDATLGAALFGFVALAGGLCTVLLFRQVVVAFWFTLLGPAVILISLSHWLEQKPDLFKPVLTGVFLAYGIGGFVWARHLFLRAQDLQWTGGVLRFPERRRDPGGSADARASRSRRPYRALISKELRLHQSTLVVAGLLTLAHLAVRVVRSFGPRLDESPILDFLVGEFWVFWLFMPILAGCTAVAEERKLGTLEGHLTLPARAGVQLSIKLGMVLALSLALGYGMPRLLDFERTFNSEIRFWIATGSVISFGLLSFYASTLARNTLQAFAPAFIGVVLTWVGIFGAREGLTLSGEKLWQGWLMLWIGVPVVILTLLALMRSNYRQVLVGWGLWRRNFLVLFSALVAVVTVTTALYQRVWEHLTTIEPAHGKARLKGAGGVSLRANGNHLLVQLPDGRVWLNRVNLSQAGRWAQLTDAWVVQPLAQGGRFLAGTNWRTAVVTHSALVAIARDGSLWKAQSAEDIPNHWRAQPANPTAIPMARQGTDGDWKAALAHFESILLLKQDGTLWRYPSGLDRAGQAQPGGPEPERLGSDADWEDGFHLDWGVGLRKRDGTTWVLQSFVNKGRAHLALAERLFAERADYLDKRDGLAWGSTVVPDSGQIKLAILADGSLRLISRWVSNPTSTSGWSMAPLDVRLGSDQDWIALAPQDGRSPLVTLKANGTLWRWNFGNDPVYHPEAAVARPLSRHSDWIAVSGFMGGFLGLSADGDLWFWRLASGYLRISDDARDPLVRPSRRPQRIGNVLGPG